MPPTIDPPAYPHIIDIILSHTDIPTLIALGRTCRHFREHQKIRPLANHAYLAQNLCLKRTKDAFRFHSLMQDSVPEEYHVSFRLPGTEMTAEQRADSFWQNTRILEIAHPQLPLPHFPSLRMLKVWRLDTQWREWICGYTYRNFPTLPAADTIVIQVGDDVRIPKEVRRLVLMCSAIHRVMTFTDNIPVGRLRPLAIELWPGGLEEVVVVLPDVFEDPEDCIKMLLLNLAFMLSRSYDNEYDHWYDAPPVSHFTLKRLVIIATSAIREIVFETIKDLKNVEASGVEVFHNYSEHDIKPKRILLSAILQPQLELMSQEKYGKDLDDEERRVILGTVSPFGVSY